MRVGDICKRSVVTCRRDASALELACLMRERRVGDVVVMDEQDGASTPIGIVTDRDLVVEVMANSVDPDMLRADEMIVGELVTVLDTELVYDAIWHMRRKGVRRSSLGFPPIPTGTLKKSNTRSRKSSITLRT